MGVPLLHMRRTATQDPDAVARFGDQGRRQGRALSRISGNRDEAVFENPFKFDIMRNPNPHIAFGGGGLLLPRRALAQFCARC